MSERLIGSVFLSTLSLRRATFTGSAWVPEFPISIHALLAESDEIFYILYWEVFISIHALLAESDIGLTYDGLIASAFLSTLSLRRATTVARIYPH